MANQFGVSRSAIRPEMRLKEDLKADDLDLVELVMEVEETFRVSIADEEAVQWKTVGQIVQSVRARQRT